MTSSSSPRPIVDGREGSATNRIQLGGQQGIFQLLWRKGLLEEVRSYVGESYVSRSGRGDEVGGVFFGQRLGELVQVLAWRPMPRGADSTSHFFLNPREEHLLTKLLISASGDPGIRGMQVLGWFRSRTKGDVIPDEADLKFHDRFFVSYSHFLMVIKPSHQRPAQASLFIRDADNCFSTTPTATISLRPGSISLEPMPPEGERPDIQIDRNQAAGSLLTSVRRVLPLATAAVLAVALTIAGLQWNQHRIAAAAQSPASLGLDVRLEGDQLRASWNPLSPAVAHADAAQLVWQGEEIKLSHEELTLGYRRIPVEKSVGDDIVITLQAGGVEESAHLVGVSRKF